MFDHFMGLAIKGLKNIRKWLEIVGSMLSSIKNYVIYWRFLLL